jgi:hypothetical protein
MTRAYRLAGPRICPRADFARSQRRADRVAARRWPRQVTRSTFPSDALSTRPSFALAIALVTPRRPILSSRPASEPSRSLFDPTKGWRGLSRIVGS